MQLHFYCGRAFWLQIRFRYKAHELDLRCVFLSARVLLGQKVLSLVVVVCQFLK